MEMAVAQGPPFVGRARERTLLEAALDQAVAGHGSTWTVQGPTGIGKTRLLHWLEDRSRARGFDIRWGYCLKEANNAYFPFYQIFRQAEPDGRPPADTTDGGPKIPPVLLFEEERPTRFFQSLVELSREHPTLLISREREAGLRQKFPGLGLETRVLGLSRVEAPGTLNPTALDTMAELAGRHLESKPGAVVGISGLEYLVSQNQFLPVLKLVQFLRDWVEATGGFLFVSYNPLALEAREVALLNGEGEVRGANRPAVAEPVRVEEAPAIVMLRYLESIEKWARQRPQVLFLDDLQWADPQSLQAFQFLSRNTRGLPVLIVASLRETEGERVTEAGDAPLEETLDAMRREGTLAPLPLGRMEDTSLAELCGHLLGAPPRLGPGTGSLSPLLDKAEGSPYFLLELVRQLRADGHLALRGGQAVLEIPPSSGDGDGLHLPDTLKRLVLRRLRMLVPEDRSLLEFAAVAGSEFEPAHLAAALGRPLPELTSTFDRMARQHGLLERPKEPGGQWSFAHQLVWEALLSEVPEARLRADAETLARWSAQHRPEDVERVTRLFHLARNVHDGPTWVKRAIERAIAETSPETVERYHRWLQELLETDRTGTDERLQIGQEYALRLHSIVGRHPAVDRMLELLMDLWATPGPHATIAAYRAFVASQEDPEGAHRQIYQLRENLEAQGEAIPPFFHALERAIEGNLQYSRGNLRSALAAYRDAIAVGGAVPSWLIDRWYYDAGWTARELDDEPTYEDCLARGRALAERLGLDRFRAYFLGLEAVTAVYHGELARAEEAELVYHRILRDRGNVTGTATSCWDLASLYILMGKYDRAREFIHEGRTVARRFAMGADEELFLLPEARIDLAEGHAERAVERLEAAVQRIRASNATGPIAGYQVTLAAARLALGDIPGAASALATVRDPAATLKPHEVPAYYRTQAQLARVRGERDDSRRAAERALEVARTVRDVIEEAHSLDELSRWELTFGTVDASERFSTMAAEIYLRTGAATRLPREPPPM